jgi:hypothetical protein
MKFHPLYLSLLVAPAAFAADTKMDPICENLVRTAAAALNSGSLEVADDGSISLDKDSLAGVSISHVRVIGTDCHGPGDCDKQNPDTFTYAANVGKTGKLVATYHRGNCSVTKFVM